MTTMAERDLSLIAKYAYGSGLTEKTKGGAGNIGLLDGKVVKFNTHRNERGGPVTDAMRKSCNDLRQNLYSIARQVLTDPKTDAAALADIRRKLGLDANGQAPANAKLLERKTVAAVVTRLGKKSGIDFFHAKVVTHEGQTKLSDPRRYASTGKVTRFEDVTRNGVARLAEKFEASHRKLFGEMATAVCKDTGISYANAIIVKGLLRHAAAGIIAEKGSVTEAELKGEGSVYDSLMKLKKAGQLTMTQVNLARSLPLQQVKPFLRACYLVPDSDPVIGMAIRLCAVADKLCKLPPEKFTPENILKLAYPDLKLTADIKGQKGPLDRAVVNAFVKPFNDLYALCDRKVDAYLSDGQEKTALCKMAKQAQSLLISGISYSDFKLVIESPEKFTTRMLPSQAFCSGDDFINSDLDDKLLGDLKRSKLNVTIIGMRDRPNYDMSPELHKDKPRNKDVREFDRQLADLCKGNIAQMRQIRLLLTQNSEAPQGILNAVKNPDMDQSGPPTGTHVVLRADSETGAVLVSKTTDPKVCRFSLSVTIRVGADGSQTVVDRQEDLGGAPLTPLDDRGLPMRLVPKGAPRPGRPKAEVAEMKATLSRIDEGARGLEALLKNATARGALEKDVADALDSYLSFCGKDVGQLRKYVQSPGADGLFARLQLRLLTNRWLGSLTVGQRQALKDFCVFGYTIPPSTGRDEFFFDMEFLDSDAAHKALSISEGVFPNDRSGYEGEDFLAECSSLRQPLLELYAKIRQYERKAERNEGQGQSGGAIGGDLQKRMQNAAQFVREKTEELFPETQEPGTKTGARTLAEAYVLNMSDNEAFVEKSVRVVNGKPQAYVKLSQTGKELAAAACTACRNELAELGLTEYKATYLREIGKNLGEKIEALADEVVLYAYFSRTSGDVRRAADRMLAFQSELGDVCCRDGKLTTFGVRVAVRATALCEEECRALADSASRCAYVKDIKTHLREKLNTVLGQHAELFNDVHRQTQVKPSADGKPDFSQPDFASFAAYMPGDAADPKTVRKIAEQFRQEIAALPDPQDRAFYLAAPDKWVAEFLERPGKAVRTLAAGWEVIDGAEQGLAAMRADVTRNQEMRDWLARKLDEAGQKNPEASFVLKEWGAKLTSATEHSHDLDSEVCRQLLVLVDAGGNLSSPEAKIAFARLSDHFLTLPLPGSMTPADARERLERIRAHVTNSRSADNSGKAKSPAEMRHVLRDIIASLQMPNDELRSKRDALVHHLAAGYDLDLLNVPPTNLELQRTFEALDALEKGEPFVKAPLSGRAEREAQIQALKTLGDDIRTQWEMCAVFDPDVFDASCGKALRALKDAQFRVCDKIHNHLAKVPGNANVSLLLNWARRELAAVEEAHGEALGRLRDLAEALSRGDKAADGVGVLADAEHVAQGDWNVLRQYLPNAVRKVFNLPAPAKADFGAVAWEVRKDAPEAHPAESEIREPEAQEEELIISTNTVKRQEPVFEQVREPESHVNAVLSMRPAALLTWAVERKSDPRIVGALGKLDTNLASRLKDGDENDWRDVFAGIGDQFGAGERDYLQGLAESLDKAELDWKSDDQKNAVIEDVLTTALVLKVLELQYVKGVEPYRLSNPTAEIQKQGTNTCPIMSVVNAMLSNEKNKDAVLQVLQPDVNKNFNFSSMLQNASIGNAQIENCKVWFNESGGNSFSDFEKAALLAMDTNDLFDKEDNFAPGKLFQATKVGRLFGKGDAVITGSANRRLTDLEARKLCRRALEALQADKPCVLRTPGHFRAIVGIEVSEDGEPSLVVWDSSGGKQDTLSIAQLMAQEAQLYVFEDSINPEKEPDAFEMDAAEILQNLRGQ